MTTYIGRDGVVEIAASIVGEQTAWNVEETGNTVQDTAMGDAAETFKATTTQWSGTVDAWFDEDDVGQIAASLGSEVALDIMPRGDSSGFQHLTGQAIVTGLTRRAERAGLVELAIAFQGTGALTVADIV